MKLAYEGSEGVAGGDSIGVESSRTTICLVTLSQDVYNFAKESIASEKHCWRAAGWCGVIGGGAKGLGGVQVGWRAGLVTSRFRVCTDLIEPATIFRINLSASSVVDWRVRSWFRGAVRTESSFEAPLYAPWCVLFAP
jgi:hypothetical protein